MPLIHSATKADLAYIAGFFDGEGCVNFTTRGKHRSVLVRVLIRNTDLSIIEHIRSLFGGRIEIARFKTKPHWKPSYCWRIDADQAVDFLCIIEPYVRIKTEQILLAQLWSAVRNRSPGVRWTDDYREMIDLLVKQMQWLNRKCNRLISDSEPMEDCLKTLPVPIDVILKEAGYAQREPSASAFHGDEPIGRRPS